MSTRQGTQGAAAAAPLPGTRTNLRDELAELIEVRLVVGVDAELADGLGELLRALKGVHLVRLVPRVLEEANVAQQLRLDVVVKEKLRKGEEPLGQELEGEVDRRVHDACKVGGGGGGDVR